MPTLGEITALLEDWYPPHTADDWDAVGLVCGDPADDVRRILLAVDPVAAVVDEAVTGDADLLVTHHPLLLEAVHGVGATTPKGRAVHRLVTHGCALFAAHTNADSPALGVSESMALALGLVDVRPLEPDPQDPRDKLVVLVPLAQAAAVRDALAEAGAGRIGDYDQASFSSLGEGRFRPLEGAHPAIGTVGTPETVPEERIEVVLPRGRRDAVVAAMRAVHPYEEPAYDVIELAAPRRERPGLGPPRAPPEPMTLRAFAERVADALPQTAHGTRVAGDPGQRVETVGLCGGARRLPARPGAVGRRRRLRDLRPAPPPRLRAPRAPGGARRWSTSPTGRPRAPGCPCSAVGWPTRWGIRWRSASVRRTPTRGPSAPRVPVRSQHPQENPLKADPFVQLRLLDVQELDNRLDALAHRLATIPEAQQAQGARAPAHPDRQRGA